MTAAVITSDRVEIQFTDRLRSGLSLAPGFIPGLGDALDPANRFNGFAKLPKARRAHNSQFIAAAVPDPHPSYVYSQPVDFTIENSFEYSSSRSIS